MLNQDSIKLFQLSQHCRSAGPSAKSQEVTLWLLPKCVAVMVCWLIQSRGSRDYFLENYWLTFVHWPSASVVWGQIFQKCCSVRDTGTSVRLAGISPWQAEALGQWLSDMEESHSGQKKHIPKEALQLPASHDQGCFFQDGLTTIICLNHCRAAVWPLTRLSYPLQQESPLRIKPSTTLFCLFIL